LAAWRAKNKDRIKETSAAWRDANRERKRAASRAWNKANRSRHKKTCDAWRKEYPEKARASVAAWKAKKPGNVRALVQKRRAALNGATGSFGAKDLADAIEVGCGLCAYCLAVGLKLTIDHVVPLSRGGHHDPRNIVMACRSCNSAKGSRGVLSMLARALTP
jgi:5-methylcytosine-specific restriction endonuclease McrA